MLARGGVDAGAPVVVAGEAGVGKTRLLQEVFRDERRSPAIGGGLSLLSSTA